MATTPTPEADATGLADQERTRLTGLAKVFAGFRDFVSRGNAVELAVGVVIGAAFGAVVGALQDAFISPLIGWIFGQPNLTDLWDIGPWSWRESTLEQPISPIKVGAILNALIQFLITAAAIYFLIVAPLNAWANRRKRATAAEEEAVADEVDEEVALLREIRDLLSARPVVPGAIPATGATVTDDTATGSAGGPGTAPPGA